MTPSSRSAAMSIVLAVILVACLALPASALVHVSRELRVSAGQSLTLPIERLEAYRIYTVTASIVGPSALAASDVIEASVECADGTTPLGMLTRQQPTGAAQIIQLGQSEPRIRLTAAGEIGGVYRVRIGWQAAPSVRMTSAEYLPSPNQNSRPTGMTVDTVVVHATVTPTLEATVNWFLAPPSQVSAHYVVGRDGTIVQMVDDTARAWHAGVSELEGKKNVNGFSVGIEIVNFNDGKDPYTDAQYAAVASIIRHLREQYEIPDSRIVSHALIARPVGRKSDPVGFDFPRLLRMARE